jgi:L-lysine exporter family protein LysE/ArgO
MVSAFAAGFALMAGLIVAIGAQNAFVLRQGLMRAHIPMLVTVCIAIDASLILAGSAGAGTLIHAHANLLSVISWVGAAFLFFYGLLACRRALTPKTLIATTENQLTAAQAVRTVLAVSLLNPHVYLDTVILVGGFCGHYAGSGRVCCAAGAIFASVCWFVILGFGARFVAPIFAKPIAWRLLDGMIALIMFAIGGSLAAAAWR